MTLSFGSTKNKNRIDKTIFKQEYAVVLRLLKKARNDAGVTQVELAGLLGQTQLFISKIERGENRLDIHPALDDPSTL